MIENIEEIPITENEALRLCVVSLFSKGSSLTTTVSTKARVRHNETVFWFADPGIWGYFPAAPLDGRRWGLWFGLTDPSHNTPVTPSLEVNLRAVPSSKPEGRALRAKNGDYLLAHTGKLGGNARGATVEEFTQNTENKNKISQIEFINIRGKKEAAFLVANLSDSDAIQQIARYTAIVREVRQNL